MRSSLNDLYLIWYSLTKSLSHLIFSQCILLSSDLLNRSLSHLIFSQCILLSSDLLNRSLSHLIFCQFFSQYILLPIDPALGGSLNRARFISHQILHMSFLQMNVCEKVGPEICKLMNRMYLLPTAPSQQIPSLIPFSPDPPSRWSRCGKWRVQRPWPKQHVFFISKNSYTNRKTGVRLRRWCRQKLHERVSWNYGPVLGWKGRDGRCRNYGTGSEIHVTVLGKYVTVLGKYGTVIKYVTVTGYSLWWFWTTGEYKRWFLDPKHCAFILVIQS